MGRAVCPFERTGRAISADLPRGKGLAQRHFDNFAPLEGQVIVICDHQQAQGVSPVAPYGKAFQIAVPLVMVDLCKLFLKYV